MTLKQWLRGAVAWLSIASIQIFAASGDVNLPYKNASDTAYVTNILPKTNSAYFQTNAQGVPILSTTVTGAIPMGGGTGTVLTKNSATNYDVSWVSPAGGGNVSSSGSITSGYTAQWNGATTIAAVANTGSGSYVLANTPILVTPNIGSATGTQVNLTSTVGGYEIVMNNTQAGSETFKIAVSNGLLFYDATNSANILTFNSATDQPAFPYLAANGVVINDSGGNLTTLTNSSATKKYVQQVSSGTPTFAQVDLAAGVTGNLSVNNLNGGTGANSSSFWRGDGSWSPPLVGGTNTQVVYFTASNAYGSNSGFTTDTSGNVTVHSLTLGSTTGIVGTTTNNSAAAGSVGEYITATQGSPVSLTSNNAADVITISLTAGDWDVQGETYYAYGTATTSSSLVDWINTTSATDPGGTVAVSYFGAPVTAAAGNAVSVLTPVVRISLSTTTTVYLSCAATFATSTLTAIGSVRARRIR